MLLLFVVAAAGVSLAAAQSQVKKQAVPGITNFAQVETTVACAGAVTPASVAEIKKMGFGSIINLRLANEQGADIDRAIAEAADLGLTSQPLKTFALDYIQAHKK